MTTVIYSALTAAPPPVCFQRDITLDLYDPLLLQIKSSFFADPKPIAILDLPIQVIYPQVQVQHLVPTRQEHLFRSFS